MIRSIIHVRILFFLGLAAFLTPARAQVHFTAQASAKEIGKDDYVEIQFIVENAKQIESFQTPEFPDFSIVQGPNQSTGMSMVNGAVSQYKGISFVLQPKKTGTLTIRPATATIDGQASRSNALQILVHAGGASGNAPPPAFNPLPDPAWPTPRPRVDMDEVIRPGENVAEKIRKNFFIKVDVSKTDCYVGEPIVATYKLYARLRSDSRVTRHPSLNGFSVYDMIDPSDDRVSVERINGKNFSVHIIRKTQLIPLQPGDITLDPVEIDNNIYFIKADPASKTSGGYGSLLDRLFQPEVNGTPFTQHLVLESKPVLVHVKPLPEAGKPADFNGAVGKYTMLASIDSREVDTGDAAILTVSVKGNGNLPVINAPVVNWPAGMESYDMNSKENIDKTSAPMGGTKSFNYSFICAKPGRYDLPPVQMSYFDLLSRSYKTIQTNPLHIQVLAKKKIHPSEKPPVAQPVTPDRTVYLWVLTVVAFAVAIMVFVVKNIKKQDRAKSKKDTEAARLEKIRLTPKPPDPLEETRGLMAAGDFGKFYASTNRAIWKSVSDTLHLPASELSKLNIASGLRNKGWSDEEIIRLKNLLNECEMKLYTPEYSTSDMHRVLQEAEELIKRMTTDHSPFV